jgi:hypothetical protein
LVSAFDPLQTLAPSSKSKSMALDDWHGEPVLNGTWRYDGRTHERITIIARNYDMRHSTYEADGMLDEGEQPVPLGPDGRLYYVAGSPPLRTLEEAKAWAEKQPWGPVEWDAN